MVAFKDLTLREGSQVPGLEISDEQGKRVIDAIADLNVRCMELSFPRAQRRESWYRYADDRGVRTAALARPIPADVDAALAVVPDEVEVIVNSSDVQLEHALGKSRDEARSILVENVEQVVDAGGAAGATLMDSMRADNEFLCECARAAVDAGARHVTLADTTGTGTSEMVRETVSAVRDAVGSENHVAIHSHDDMGAATANAVTAVTAGATAVDATVGGIGERAGNAPLEEVAVHLTERGDATELARRELIPICREVHDVLGVEIPPGKPIIGDRAFKHESGLHTAAMLREPRTYMPFDPEEYGGSNQLLFGSDTGRGAVRALLEELGTEPTNDRVDSGLEAIRAEAELSGPFDQYRALDLLDRKVR